MDKKYISSICTIGMGMSLLFLLIVVFAQMPKVDALPQRTLVDDYFNGDGFNVDRFDRDYYVSVPLSSYHLNRLRRGYYYIDDGFITSVPSYGSYAASTSNRRQDSNGDDDAANGRRSTSFQPLVKYKQTKTKHKKLFVPNFFG